MDGKRIYTKIDEFNFKVEQDRHIEEDMAIDKQFNYLAQCLNGLRQCISGANEFQDKFVKIVGTYNTYLDILAEAKEQCGYTYKLPERIELPDCFDIIEVKAENLPTIDFKLDENKQG